MPSRSPKPDWSTIHERIDWLVKARFDGNRAKLAAAIGYTRAMIGNVVRDHVPGPRMIEAIIARLKVERSWLQDGKGQPFGAHVREEPHPGIAVSRIPLPGHPLNHQEMITDGWSTFSAVAPSPSLYWLALSATQDFYHSISPAIGVHDYLLMETDREKFPVESKLWDTLCVVRAGAEGGEPQLARVSYFEADVEDGPERLEAEFAIPKKPKGLGEVTKHVYLHLPDGEIRYEGRRLPREAPQLVEVPLRRIRYTDIAAVWMRIIHRPSG